MDSVPLGIICPNCGRAVSVQGTTPTLLREAIRLRAQTSAVEIRCTHCGAIFLYGPTDENDRPSQP